MEALPRVTLGKDLCKTHHQSLMARNYASPNLHKTLIIYDWLTISREGLMQNAKKSRYLAISLQLTMNLITTSHLLQQVSPL